MSLQRSDRRATERATIGIENADGTIALQYTYRQPVLRPGMGVHISPPAYPAWWWLDGDGTDSAAGAVNPLTLTGAVGWVDGPLIGPAYPTDQALHLDGTTTAASTAGPVVHTSGSFTVTALVNTADLSSTRMAVSQDGVNISGFKLGQLHYSSLCPAEIGPTCWAFWVANQDSTSTTHTGAVPVVDPNDPQHFAIQPNTWTALAGVYDAYTHELRLYINGELAGTTGPLRSRSAGG